MLATIIQWFQAPAFPEDEDKTRSALLLNAVLNTFLFALPVLFVSSLLGARSPRFERNLIIIACAWLTIFGTRLLMRSGQVTAAGTVTVIILFISTTLALYNLGTIRAPATSFYFLAIVTAGLTINRRAILWVAGLSAAAVIALLIGEINNFLPAPNHTATATQGITFTVVFAVIAILLFLSVKRIDDTLARIREELTERANAKENEKIRRKMMEKVIQIGKSVTAQNSDLRATLFKIRESIRNSLDFDRAAIFLHDPIDNSVQGSYGTDRAGNMSEEWDLKFTPREDGFLQRVLEQPDGFYYTPDYENELNIASIPGNAMSGVKHYAAVAVWANNKPIGVIVVDQLVSGRVISNEQLEALRLFAGYAGLAIDNTHLNVELAGRMQERENFISELGKRNAELERFTYTVSHDLRSPLVTIKGFLGMLKKDLAENHQDHITSDMQRIAGATDKMDTLLSDLLELSRVGRIVNPPEEIDLVKLAYITLETIDGRLRAKNITTQISPDLPTLYGDRVRLGEVLENLMDNAAKYIGEQINPHIEIGHRNDNGEQVIYVRDNGMGIEPQYLQRVFGLFEKLNPTSEGTGIGLALIKRIVEVHGGRIWVESEGLGKGSIFCFVIPDGRNSKS